MNKIPMQIEKVLTIGKTVLSEETKNKFKKKLNDLPMVFR